MTGSRVAAARAAQFQYVGQAVNSPASGYVEGYRSISICSRIFAWITAKFSINC